MMTRLNTQTMMPLLRLIRPAALHRPRIALRTITFTSNGERENPSRRSSGGGAAESSSNDNWLRSPKDVAQHLDRYIIGQEKAKKILAVAVYNHYHRILESREREELPLTPPASPPTAIEMDNRSRGRKRRKDDSIEQDRGHHHQEDAASEVHELIKVNRDSDPTLVHEVGSWQDRYRDSSANEVALDDADAPPTLLGRVSKRMFNSPPKKAKVDDDLEDVTIEKSNVLMVGPTGSGKTLLAKTLAKILDVPFASSDATSFTQVGYVGDDVESCVMRLLRAADFDVGRTEMGIIHIDECDKLARRGTGSDSGGYGTRDVGGEGVQQGLLKLLEGTVVSMQAKPPPHLAGSSYQPTTSSSVADLSEPQQRGLGFPTTDLGSKRGLREGLPAYGGGSASSSKGEHFMIDTSNILFILSGAFVGLDKIIGRRKGSGSMGFNEVLPERPSEEDDAGGVRPDHLQGLRASDLVEYGFIPEFVGRLPVLATLHPLSLDDLVRVLVEPKSALIKQYRKLFARSDCELQFSHAALIAIATEASKKGGSARHLRSVLEELLLDAMYEVPASSVRYAAVTAAVVRGEEPVLYFSRPQQHLWKQALEYDQVKVEPPAVEEEDDRVTAFG